MKDREDSDTSPADGSQSLLSQLPSSALSTVEEEKSAPINTSVWFEQSMFHQLLCCAVHDVTKESDPRSTDTLQAFGLFEIMWIQNWQKVILSLFSVSFSFDTGI